MVERRNRIHAFTKSLNERVRDALKTRKFVYPVIARLAALEKADPDEFISAFVTGCQNRFEESIIRSTFSTPESPGVPRLRHRIWITDPDSPSFPSDVALKNIAAEIRAQESSGWRNVFWINSALVESQVRALFSELNAPVVLRSISEFAGHPAYPTLATLIADRKFVLACDVARILIVNREGGLYTDLGIHLEKGVLDAIEISDYAVILGNTSFFQSSLFAARAGSKITELMTAIFIRPEAVPAEFVRAKGTIGPVDEVNLFAGPGLSLVLINFAAICDRVLIVVADGRLVVWSAERSWYGDPKFGNVDLAASAVSVLDETKYEASGALRAQAVRTFGDVGRLRLKLQILIGLGDYFHKNPTRLCRMLFHNGSDKALWWHNYSYIYYHLFQDFVAAKADLLEVGIGTNNLDVPSTMGVTGVPGASLRAWKEFLIDGTVHGADVDRRILFQESGISTSFVDQTDPATIDAMWRDLERIFDVIIDDGLHRFDANVSFYERSRAHVSPNGWFVVEDVKSHEEPAWADYIVKNKLNAVILALPNDRNKQDNCLVIFPPALAASAQA